MKESKLHLQLKEIIKEALEELGYKVELEKRIGQRIVDVFASRNVNKTTLTKTINEFSKIIKKIDDLINSLDEAEKKLETLRKLIKKKIIELKQVLLSPIIVEVGNCPRERKKELSNYCLFIHVSKKGSINILTKESELLLFDLAIKISEKLSENNLQTFFRINIESK